MTTKEAPSALSEHLLREAQGFFFYPNRARRTKSSLHAQTILDGHRRRLLDWRKAFASAAEGDLETFLFEPVLLDELYSRELLAAVPGIVGRTLRLSRTTFAGAESEPRAYLREAANCFIFGIPQAAAALARAAVERAIRDKVAQRLGSQTAGPARWMQLLDGVMPVCPV